jgi:hypothetical protein
VENGQGSDVHHNTVHDLAPGGAAFSLMGGDHNRLYSNTVIDGEHWAFALVQSAFNVIDHNTVCNTPIALGYALNDGASAFGYPEASHDNSFRDNVLSAVGDPYVFDEQQDGRSADGGQNELLRNVVVETCPASL